MNLPHCLGPCTPAGAPHHYTFTLIATDLEPTALQSGMTRDECRLNPGASIPAVVQLSNFWARVHLPTILSLDFGQLLILNTDTVIPSISGGNGTQRRGTVDLQ